MRGRRRGAGAPAADSGVAAAAGRAAAAGAAGSRLHHPPAGRPAESLPAAPSAGAAAWRQPVPGQPVERQRPRRADARRRRRGRAAAVRTADGVAPATPARSRAQAVQVGAGRSARRQHSRRPCPISPENTVSSLVSPTSDRSPGRSRRRRAAAGARLALTYPSERLEENVRELAAKLDNPLVAAVRRRERRADRRRSPRRSTRSSAASTSSCTARRSRRAASSSNPFVADVARGLPHRARRQRLLADRADARGACR